MNKEASAMDSIDHTFNQARTDLNFLYTKLSVDANEGI
jgi:hypothetical protein